MASTVTEITNVINVNFPVPGADNDSQGFRTNFSNIQQGFNRAATEITDLQLNSVRINTTNDFGYNVLKRASVQADSSVVNEVGLVAPGSYSVDYSLGNYQTYSITSGSYTLGVINWPPDGQCGTIRLEFTPDSTATTSLTFTGPVTFLDTAITTSTQSYNQTRPIVWELFTPDGGTSKILAYQLK